MGVALVLGGADTLHADLAAAQALLGETPVTIVATNHAGRDHPGPVDHWCTFHVELLPTWIAARTAAGRPPAGQHWGVTRYSIPPNDMPVKRVENWGGSSGLVAVTVALEELQLRHVLLCGVPMDMAAAHYDNPAPWRDAGNYRRAWIQRREQLAGLRSMSGWTRDMFGSPDAAWLQEVRQCESAR